MSKKIIILLSLCCIAITYVSNVFAAANFSITPFGTLPTTIATGQSVSAYYTVTNMTNTSLFGYVVNGLPASVTQNTTSPNCTNPISLTAHASCKLQLDITSPVSTSFAICHSVSCTTASAPLNVSASSTPPVPPTPPVPTIPKYAYITQDVGSSVIACAVNQTTGLLENCQSAAGGSAITGITPQGINISSDNTTAFISQGESAHFVYQCPIVSNTGLFGTCTSTTVTSPSGYMPYYGFLTTNSATNLAYLNDYNSGLDRVLACPVSGDVIAGNCQDTGATGLGSFEIGITLNASNTIAYLGGYSNGAVTTCAVNGSTFSACGNKTGDGAITFTYPIDAVLNTTGTIVYVTDYNSKEVIGCNVTSLSTTSSTFSSCFVATTLATGPWGIALNATNTMAYITNLASTVYQCPILGNGTFDTCTANATFSTPVDIALVY